MKKVKRLFLILFIVTGLFSYASAAGDMRTSDSGIVFLKQQEGLRTTAYKAVSTEKYYTIGYGHYGSDVYAGMVITEQQAENLLRSDLPKYENYVNTFLNKYGITINQNQFDALVSFSYNLGNVWVSTETFQLKTYLINGISNYSAEQITVAFTNWNKSGGKVLEGLTARRQREAALFLSAYGPGPGPTPENSEKISIEKPGGTYEGTNDIDISGWIVSNTDINYGFLEISGLTQVGIRFENEPADIVNQYPNYKYHKRFTGSINIYSLSSNTRYNYTVYITLADGRLISASGTFQTGTIVQDTTVPAISDVKITDISASGYTVSCKVTDDRSVGSVRLAAWTTANGQDDLKWIVQDGKGSSGTYSFRVNVSEHNGEGGIYANHIYAYDSSNNESKAQCKDVKIPSNAIIHVAAIEGGPNCVTVNGWAYDPDLPSALLSIDVYNEDLTVCYGRGYTTILNSALNTEKKITGNHGFDFKLPVNTTGSQVFKLVAVGIDETGKGDGYSSSFEGFATTVTSDTTKPTISSAAVTNITEDGYVVECKVSDNGVIDRVQFPTWTTANEQDDIVTDWQTNTKCSGTKSGNTYRFVVKKSDHNNEIGSYITDIYVFDGAGNYANKRVTAAVPRNVQSVTLNKTSLKLVVGNSEKLTATILPNDATNKTITWKSYDESVAIVNNGTITAKASGTAVITVASHDNAIVSECIVTVVPKIEIAKQTDGANIVLKSTINDKNRIVTYGIVSSETENPTLDTNGRTEIIFTDLDANNSFEYRLDSNQKKNYYRAYVIYTQDSGNHIICYSDVITN